MSIIGRTPIEAIELLATLSAKTLIGTDFEGALADHAQPLLAQLALHAPREAEKSDSTGIVLNAPANRLAFAKRRSGKVVEAVILLESENGRAAAAAARVGTTAQQKQVPTLVIGQAYSSWPDDTKPSSRKPMPGNFDHVWRPGRSVAHVRKQAGTLGAFVTFKVRKKDYQGFVGCAHVLAPPNEAGKGDVIVSPGPPDRPRNPGAYSCGKLSSWIDLVHYVNQSAPDHVVNGADIAAVEFDDISEMPSANLVPNPADPEGKEIKLKKVLADDDILDLTGGGEVYMVGRTSGFAAGIVDTCEASPMVVKLPNGRAYMYKGLITISPKDKKRGFSQPGDSGAPVYTAAGGLVGFVVAGTGSHTLVQPGSVLDEIGAQLI